MRWPLLFMTLAVVAGSSSAQSADPLKSTECVQALDALQAQEAAMTAAAQRKDADEPAQRLAAFEALQKRAAQACLGSRPDAPPPVHRFTQPPIAVAPVTPSAAGAVMPPAPAAAPPPIQIPPLKTITLCDPAGCWASDGTRLSRMGSILVGPLGLCTVQGAVLSCH